MTITLGPDVRISTAEELRAQLFAALETGGPLLLDASMVCYFDSGGAQVLVAFFQAAVARDVAVSWLKQSCKLQEQARLLGLQSALCLDRTVAEAAA